MISESSCGNMSTQKICTKKLKISCSLQHASPDDLDAKIVFPFIHTCSRGHMEFELGKVVEWE